MTRTDPTDKMSKSTGKNDKVTGKPGFPVDELLTIILRQGKPVTAQEVTAKLGDASIKQVSATLDELADRGTLVKFRAGLNDYYATPKVALTEQEPVLRAVMSDSLKSLLLIWRYRVMGKLGGTNAYYRSV